MSPLSFVTLVVTFDRRAASDWRCADSVIPLFATKCNKEVEEEKEKIENERKNFDKHTNTKAANECNLSSVIVIIHYINSVTIRRAVNGAHTLQTPIKLNYMIT